MLYTGEIPFSLFNISSLMEIVLDKNSLNGSLPHKMCRQFSQLQTFSIDHNDYGGIIPRSIGNCTSLQYFSSSNNFFIGIFSIFYRHI
jgi:hypothetical protein